MDDSERPAYVVPRYRATDDPAFYHFLHGTVPGHQIDFMYGPEVPQGALAQTHFGHLSRIIKYIEPREGATYAFALGNLSRDDVQHEPGHGGIAILFALRVPGVTDHAGRDMPPYAHGIVAVDRHLDYVTLLESITVLYRRFLEREGADDRRGDFYRSYVRTVLERPEEVDAFLSHAIAELDDIPRPRKSKLAWDYLADESTPAKRITIVHDDDESFATLAHYAALIGAALHRSNVKWTSITSGREIDIPGGTTIRLVPRSEAPSDPRGVFAVDDLPDGEDELMNLLFGARRRVEEIAAPRQGWREKLAAQRPGLRSEPPPAHRSAPPGDSQDRGDLSVDVDIDDAAATLPVAPLEPDPGPAPGAPSNTARAVPFDPRRSSPMTGVAAASLGGAASAAAASAFDPRRSSPTTGVSGVGSTAAGFQLPPRSPGAQSTADLPGPMSGRVPIPSAPGSDPASIPSSDVGFRVYRENRARKGRWIIAAAAFAAIAVIVVVSVVAGMNLQGDGSDKDGDPGPGTTGQSATTGPSATTGQPATTSQSPATSQSTTTTRSPTTSQSATTGQSTTGSAATASSSKNGPKPGGKKNTGFGKPIF